MDARTWVHVDGWLCQMEHVRGMFRSLLVQWDGMRGEKEKGPAGRREKSLCIVTTAPGTRPHEA